MADTKIELKSTFDEELFNRFCVAIGKAGLIERYLEFAYRYESPFRDQAPGPNMKEIVKVIQDHGATAKLYSKWRVIELCSEVINGWWWTGKLVMKRYNVIEVQFEGKNGIQSLGSTMSDISHVASDLISKNQDSFSIPFKFPCPRYDGDDERLARMMAEVVEYFNEIKNVIRRDLTDFPKGTL
jgi:hypothetical protein